MIIYLISFINKLFIRKLLFIMSDLLFVSNQTRKVFELLNVSELKVAY